MSRVSLIPVAKPSLDRLKQLEMLNDDDLYQAYLRMLADNADMRRLLLKGFREMITDEIRALRLM